MKRITLLAFLCFTCVAAVLPGVAAAAVPAEVAEARRLQGELRYAEADSLLRVAIARLDVKPLPDSLALADALHLFAVGRSVRAMFTDSAAIAAANRALAIRERALPPGSDALGNSQLTQVRYQLGAGHTDEAVAMLRRLVALRTPYATPRDTILPEAWRGLGFALRDQGDAAAAVAAFDSTLARRRSARGEDRVFGLTLAELGRGLMLLGRFGAARDSMHRALEIVERQPGATYAAALVFDYMATLERAAGNLTRAIDHGQEALRRITSGPVPDSTEIARLQRNLSSCLNELGDYAGTRALLEATLPIYRRSYGPNHWRVASLLNSLGNAKVGLRDSSGLSDLRTAETIYLSRRGGPNAELARVRHTLANLELLEGRPLDAAATCARGLDAISGNSTSSLRVVVGQLHSLRLHALVMAGVRDTATLETARRALLGYAAEQVLDSSSIGDEVHAANARALDALGRPDEAWDEALRSEALSRESSNRVARALGDEHALLHSSQVGARLDLLCRLAAGGGPAADARWAQAWDRVVRGRGQVRAELARRHAPAAFAGDTVLTGAHARWDDAQQQLARASLDAGAERSPRARAALDRARAEAAERERLYARALAERGLAARARGDARRRAREAGAEAGARLAARGVRRHRLGARGRVRRACRERHRRPRRPRPVLRTARARACVARAARALAVAGARGAAAAEANCRRAGQRVRARVGRARPARRRRRGRPAGGRRTARVAAVAGAARAARPMAGRDGPAPAPAARRTRPARHRGRDRRPAPARAGRRRLRRRHEFRAACERCALRRSHADVRRTAGHARRGRRRRPIVAGTRRHRRSRDGPGRQRSHAAPRRPARERAAPGDARRRGRRLRRYRRAARRRRREPDRASGSARVTRTPHAGGRRARAGRRSVGGTPHVARVVRRAAARGQPRRRRRRPAHRRRGGDARPVRARAGSCCPPATPGSPRAGHAKARWACGARSRWRARAP
ncbi:MAG: tetratricopeptide repeat protein [Candidatus Eisenbacteria bacterium]